MPDGCNSTLSPVTNHISVCTDLIAESDSEKVLQSLIASSSLVPSGTLEILPNKTLRNRKNRN